MRPEVLEGAPLRFAPQNELGVVFLFAHLAKRRRLRIDAIQSGFPDCIAYQKVGGNEKKVRIEFEYRSRNFKLHGHSARRCDLLVCWEDNWPDPPKGLEILELRKEFGLGFNVWVAPVGGEYKEELDATQRDEHWSLPSQAHKDDLILFYCATPDRWIEHLFVTMDRARKVSARWKSGMDYMGPIRRVCRLEAPIFWEDLKRHRILSTANFVRAQMRNRRNATEYWPYLYEMIVRRNPSAKSKLKRFAPANL